MKKLTLKDAGIAFISSFVLSQFFVILVSSLVQIGFAFFSSPESYANFTNSAVNYLISVIALNFVLTVIFFIFNNNKDNKIIEKPTVKKIFLYIAIGVAIFFLLYPINYCINTLFIKIGIKPSLLTYSLNTPNYLISIVSLVILPAVCEELLFRGLIFKALKPKGKIFSIIISALMFALFHMSINQLFHPFIVGLILGLVMYKENNVTYCIIIHAINNFISLTLQYLNISLIFNHWTYILVAIILFLALLVFLLYFIFKNHKLVEKTNFEKQDTKTFYFCLAIMVIIWIIIVIAKQFTNL